jgi:hypothetical protein
VSQLAKIKLWILLDTVQGDRIKRLLDTVQGDRIKRQNIIHGIVFLFGSAAAWGYANGKLFPFLGFSE